MSQWSLYEPETEEEQQLVDECIDKVSAAMQVALQPDNVRQAVNNVKGMVPAAERTQIAVMKMHVGVYLWEAHIEKVAKKYSSTGICDTASRDQVIEELGDRIDDNLLT